MSEFSRNFMKWCAEKSTHFVETGTFKGVTTKLASKHFKSVSSIEIDQNNFDYSSNKLKGIQNIKLIFGDVLDNLPDLLKNNENEKMTFWLDAHPMDPEVDESCPLLTELDMIREHSNRKDHIVLIDDLQRCFNGDGDYPKAEELKEKLLLINPDYNIYELPFKSWGVKKGDPSILCATTETIDFPVKYYLNPLSSIDKYLRFLRLKR